MATNEIIDTEQVIEAWLAPEDGDDNDQPRPQHANRASEAGHDCDRYLTLVRTNHELKKPPSQILKAIFKRGKLLERPVAQRQMQKAGWDLMEPQAEFIVRDTDGSTLLTAHIDGVIRKLPDPNLYVWESKVINEHDWARIPPGIDGYEFLRASSKPWLRGYPTQLMVYMHAKPGAAAMGLLHFVNAATLLPKFVIVPFDPVYLGEILDRARRINRYVQAVNANGPAQLPPPIEWSEDVCGRCRMIRACLPDQERNEGGLEVIDDARFEQLVEDERIANEEKITAEKKHKDLRARVVHLMGEKDNVRVGRWWIQAKTIGVAERVQKAYTYQRLDFKPMEAKASKESAA